MGVAHNIIERIDVQSKDILVIGCGPVGLFAISCAKENDNEIKPRYFFIDARKLIFEVEKLLNYLSRLSVRKT